MTVQRIFDELDLGKQSPQANPSRLEGAIAAYRAFETESSLLAVSLLDECGGSRLIDPYSNFMQADLEALSIFHRTGTAPVGTTFFRRWNNDVRCGHRIIIPFEGKRFPRFTPVLIESQRILQRQSTDA